MDPHVQITRTVREEIDELRKEIYQLREKRSNWLERSLLVLS